MSDKNAVATQTTQTPMELAIDNKFINQLSEQLTQKQQYGLSFPPNYNVTNALNSAYLIIQELTVSKKQGNEWIQIPVTQVCSKQSIASSLIDMTVQALNPMKKQCYFVAFGNKLTLMRSYQGTMAVAKRCGVKKISSEVIYDGDSFKYHIEDGIKVIDEHVQDFMNIDNEKIKGAYAILTMEDGSTYTEVMNIHQIKKAWAKGKGYDPNKATDVHNEFADQMAQKTVVNRACRNFINSSDDANTTDNEEIDSTEVEVQHDIETQANTEDFEIPPEVEKVHGEVVGEPKKETAKEKKESKSSKAEKVVEPEVETPSWMN
jgi:recombination protein RecT